MRSLSRFFAKTAVLAIVACGSILAIPAAAQTRHHISFGLGYTKHLSDNLKDQGSGLDMTNAANGGIAYRYSLTPQFDLSLDSDATASIDEVAGVDFTLTNSFVGPGIRWNAPSSSSVRPFLQGNVYLVNENIELKQGGVKVSTSESSAGFGLKGGIDVTASRLLSFPLSIQYLYGKPADDVSGFGMNVAIAFNFGSEL